MSAIKLYKGCEICEICNISVKNLFQHKISKSHNKKICIRNPINSIASDDFYYIKYNFNYVIYFFKNNKLEKTDNFKNFQIILLNFIKDFENENDNKAIQLMFL